jgi:hypothetical protein
MHAACSPLVQSLVCRACGSSLHAAAPPSAGGDAHAPTTRVLVSVKPESKSVTQALNNLQDSIHRDFMLCMAVTALGFAVIAWRLPEATQAPAAAAPPAGATAAAAAAH